MTATKLRKRLLFIDPHQAWLDFVESALSESFEVVGLRKFSDMVNVIDNSPLHFDLIFIGLNLARDNLEILSDLAQSSQNSWDFIVLFPGSPDGTTASIFFKAGMRDLLSKPYDPDSLKKMVEAELKQAEERAQKVQKRPGSADYLTRTRRLQEYVAAKSHTKF